jgi:hypothetical protein
MLPLGPPACPTLLLGPHLCQTHQQIQHSLLQLLANHVASLAHHSTAWQHHCRCCCAFAAAIAITAQRSSLLSGHWWWQDVAGCDQGGGGEATAAAAAAPAWAAGGQRQGQLAGPAVLCVSAATMVMVNDNMPLEDWQ